MPPDEQAVEFEESLVLSPDAVRTGPAVACRPLQYWRFRFTAAAECPAYWQVVFTDAAGADLPGDVCSSIDPCAAWTPFSSVVRVPPHACAMKVAFRGMDDAIRVLKLHDEGRRVRIARWGLEPFSTEAAREWADRLYGELPPLIWQPEPGQRGLESTRARLQAGGNLCVALLGASDINDLSHSLWELLVTRARPNVTIEVHPLIGDRARIHAQLFEADAGAAAAPSRSDLAIVSDGLARELGADGLVRVGERLACELLVIRTMTFPDVRMRNQNDEVAALAERLAAATPDGAAVAEAGGAVFFDMRTPFIEYLLASNAPLNGFNRDILHANDRGRQIAARFLSEFLTSE